VGEFHDSWNRTGVLIAAGSLILLLGLLAGPTPSEDPATALQDISSFQDRWILTNGIDLIGLVLLVVGVGVLSRLIATSGTSMILTSAANLGAALGGLLIGAVLVIQTTVDVGLAANYTASTGGEQNAYAILASAVLDLEAGLFALGLVLFMFAVASVSLALDQTQVPPLQSWFLYVGVGLTVLSGLTGFALLIEALRPFARMEPYFALAALLWLAILGGMISRMETRAD
jgi:hypothetical protein